MNPEIGVPSGRECTAGGVSSGGSRAAHPVQEAACREDGAGGGAPAGRPAPTVLLQPQLSSCLRELERR